MKKNYI